MKPYQRPPPPIAVAASTPTSGSMKMAGERGFIPMSSSLLSRRYLADHWKPVEDGAHKAGPPAKRGACRVALDLLDAPTPAVAREPPRPLRGGRYERPPLPPRG